MRMELMNCALLLGEALLYFAVMAGLFRLRKALGIGLVICALGVMHFLETYLAAVFYVALPFGVISPGSVVLFSGKLAMLLLIYLREDAVTVRQPIYGLLIGNILTIGLVAVLRFHEAVPIIPGRLPDIGFIDTMGGLMIWGTTLLFVDAIAVILLYEKLGAWIGRAQLPRVLLALATILTFDQAGFYIVLRLLTDAPLAVFFGGWIAKMGAAVVFSLLLVAYLRWIERDTGAEPGSIADIFSALSYRERYEALLEHSGRDGLTGLLHRGRFEAMGRDAMAAHRRDARPVTLLIIDIDHFKQINDRHGHVAGDQVIRAVADALGRCGSQTDRIFRIGGEEFAILSDQPLAIARILGERIRHDVMLSTAALAHRATVSIGVAVAGSDGSDLPELFAAADRCLYAAKANGRDRVVTTQDNLRHDASLAATID